jgi:hypothetical protein
MHLDYTIHFWATVGYISSFGGVATFLWKIYRLGARFVTAAEVMIDQHREMYGWYSEHVKPKQKVNGRALGGVNYRG